MRSALCLRLGHAFLPGESDTRSLDFPRPHEHCPRPQGGAVRGPFLSPRNRVQRWNPLGSTPRNGAVAQLGERLVRNEEVSGSIPLSSTIPQALITPDRCRCPLALSAGGRRFAMPEGLYAPSHKNGRPVAGPAILFNLCPAFRPPSPSRAVRIAGCRRAGSRRPRPGYRSGTAQAPGPRCRWHDG